MEGGWDLEKCSRTNQQIRNIGFKIGFPPELINEAVELKLFHAGEGLSGPYNIQTGFRLHTNERQSLIYYATIDDYGIRVDKHGIPKSFESAVIYFTPVGIDGTPVIMLNDNDLTKFSVAKEFVKSNTINIVTLKNCCDENGVRPPIGIPLKLLKLMDKPIPLGRIIPYLLDYSLSDRKIDWENPEDVNTAKMILSRVSTSTSQMAAEIPKMEKEVKRLNEDITSKREITNYLCNKYGNIETLNKQIDKLAMGNRVKLVKEKEEIDQQIAALRAKSEEIRKQLGE